MTDYAIDVHHLYKSFAGNPAVIDLSLRVQRGEIMGFLGPNGSGKTTTIRMLCGLMIPDSGSGTCLGYDIVRDAAMIKRLVGYVPQNFSLYHDLTVKENLKFIASVYSELPCDAQVVKIMRELDLTPYQDVLAARLSGGWKQRLSLAAALIHEPKLLLLDEPTAGVDPKARRDFWDVIANLTTQGITSLVSTHYMDEAERCNHLAYIVFGRLMAQGTVHDIIQKVGLKVWTTSGIDLVKLAAQLRIMPGVSQVVVWGDNLRIIVQDQQVMSVIAARFPNYRWHEAEANLEEVFVHLVSTRQTGQVTT